MSVLGNIRKRTGLLLIVVAGGIFLFLIQDALRSQTSLFGPQENSVGEIAGEQIDQERYSALVAQMVENYTMQQRQAPDDFTMRGIRDQAWSQLIFEIAYQKQFDELGIQVTNGDEEAESIDMVQGRFVDERIKNSFRNEKGEFDQAQLIQYLQRIGDASTEEELQSAAQWKAFENQLVQNKLRSKYENLLIKSNYITTAEAKQAYLAEQDTALISYLYVPYASIEDSTITVLDEEKQDYIGAHKAEYKVDAGRSFDYVVYDIKPSDKDIANTLEKISAIKVAFSETKDDTAFVRSRSDKFTVPSQMEYNQLPFELKRDSAALASSIGFVFGPYQNQNSYFLYKILDFKKADTIQKATASHILISTLNEQRQPLSEEEKAAAQQKAQQILARALSGENFAELAKTESQDPGSGANGGDLGEFKTGSMVQPFQEAVFGAKKTGVIPTLVESQFGYHIINVTKKAEIDEIKSKYTVATIEKELFASKETRNELYKKATAFWKEAKNNGFEQALGYDSSVIKQEAKFLAPDATGFGQVRSGRNVLGWAFDDNTSVGDVSDIFRLDEYYIIAQLTKVREEGLAKVEDVDEIVTRAIRKEKKADMIIELLEKHKGEDFHVRMEAINKEKGEGFATKNFAPVTLRYNTNYISGLGSEPAVIGTAFGMKKGWSEKIIGENGVFIVELKERSETPEIADYSVQKARLLQQFMPSQYGQAKDIRNLEEVITEFSDVKDYRYKFY